MQIDQLINCYELNRSYKAFPVYLSFAECLYKNAQNGEGVFLRSSYILPNNYSTIENKLKRYEVVFKMQERTLKDTFEIGLNQAEIKKSFSDFDKKVKENEFKLVQIVAMFVSIATFVLINVKIFDGKTGLESFGITLGLAACFVFFNLFFHFIVIAQYKEKKTFFYILFKFAYLFFLPIILLVGSYFLLKSEGRKNKQEVIDLSTRQHNSDSIQKLLQQQIDDNVNNFKNLRDSLDVYKKKKGG